MSFKKLTQVIKSMFFSKSKEVYWEVLGGEKENRNIVKL